MSIKNFRLLALSFASVVVSASAFFGSAPDASAQLATQVICFRGRDVTIPSYLLSRYVAAGATPGPCNPSP